MGARVCASKHMYACMCMHVCTCVCVCLCVCGACLYVREGMCATASCVGVREQPWEPPFPILFDTQCPLLYSSAVLAGPKASGDSPSSSSSQKELPYLSLCGFWGLELRNEHSTVSALYISLLMCLRVITAHCRGLHSSVCEP